ncbi:MAG: DUF4339 domain-containing protein [Planctomycetia bacterium]|nr:DUF4339 domain-containing protein [Planctomycetia bacterium]
MGIKFNCPQCQKKLNVKSFLAGKRGVCPHCGAAFEIPKKTEGRGDGQAAASAGAAPGGVSLAATTKQSSVPTVKAPAPTSAPSAPAPVLSTPSAPSPAPVSAPVSVAPAGQPSPAVSPAAAVATLSPAAGASAMPIGAVAGQLLTQPLAGAAMMTGQPAGVQAVGVQAVRPGMAPAPMSGYAAVGVAAMPDPLVDAPSAVWYVRPPSGGQFGPAKSDVMRRWVDEGRVTPDSLVWREGWPDWKQAQTVFPRYSAMPAPVPMGAMPALPVGLSAPVGYPAGPMMPGMASAMPAGAMPAAVMPGMAVPMTDPMAGTGRRTVYRRRSNTATVAAIIVLSFMLIAGVVILIMVLKDKF